MDALLDAAIICAHRWPDPTDDLVLAVLEVLAWHHRYGLTMREH